MAINDETKELIKSIKVYSLATASKSGEPNVVPIGMLIVKDNCIWIVDNFMKKTYANLRENPRASFYAWDPEKRIGYQFKCDVFMYDSGKDYEEAVAFAHAKSESMPAKTLLKLKVTDVYDIRPGPDAGKKII